MTEVNKVHSQNSAEYIKQLAEEQRLRQREEQQIQAKEETRLEEKDQLTISQEARRLAEAQDFYRKFLEEKAKEVEARRMERVKKLKEQVQRKPNSPLHIIAEKISQEYFGL